MIQAHQRATLQTTCLTPLLPTYTGQFPCYTTQTTLDRHLMNIPLDTFNGHGSLSEIHKQIYDLFTLDPYDSLLQSVTMPIKNFFLSSSLAPARSSLYLRPAYTTSMSLNCNHQNPHPSSGMTINCTSPVSDPTPGMALNCNFGHLGHLGNIGDLGHLGHLRHLGHLSHLGHLGNIGDLHDLDPYPLDPAPTDSLPGAFITEMDPTDPGPLEGCYADNSLDPLHTRTLETVTQATQDRLPLRSTTQDRQTPSMGTAPSRGYS
jgi:hypothetical protein